MIERLRLIKTPAELELIRRSTEIIEASVADLYEQIEIGMSRVELMRLARSSLVGRGATGFSHITFSFGEANPEDRHRRATGTRNAGDVGSGRDIRRLLLG